MWWWLYIYIYNYIYTRYEHEAIQLLKTENNIGAPSAPQKTHDYTGKHKLHSLETQGYMQSLPYTYMPCLLLSPPPYTHSHSQRCTHYVLVPAHLAQLNHPQL